MNGHDSTGVLIESKALGALKKTRLRAVDCVLGDCWLLCKPIDGTRQQKPFQFIYSHHNHHRQPLAIIQTHKHELMCKHTQSNGVMLILTLCNVQRRSVCQLKILGKMAFYALSDQFFRALCCGVQMTTATTYTETPQLTLFEFLLLFLVSAVPPIWLISICASNELR